MTDISKLLIEFLPLLLPYRSISSNFFYGHCLKLVIEVFVDILSVPITFD